MRLGFVLLSCLALGDGDRLLRAGDVDGAAEAYRDALSENPEDARLELRLARALLMGGQVEDALVHAENGRSARGGEAVYAEALLRNGRVDEAAGLAEGAVLGEVLLAQGEFEGAMLLIEDHEQLEWIRARQGDLTEATTTPAGWLIGAPAARPALDGERDRWLAEARLRADGGDVENAARLTLRALSAGEDVPTLALAAQLLAQLGEDALPLANRANELATTDEELAVVARLLADLAPNAEAEIAALEEAARFGVDGPLLFRLALAYEGVGRRPEAARAAVASADRGHEPARVFVAERYRAAGRPEQAARYEAPHTP